GDALAADLHQGLEAMGLATEEAVLGGGQDNWHRVRDGLRGGSGYHGGPSRRGRRARPPTHVTQLPQQKQPSLAPRALLRSLREEGPGRGPAFPCRLQARGTA